jgi:hypothetical protein
MTTFEMPDDLRAGVGAACKGTAAVILREAGVTGAGEESRTGPGVAVVDGSTAAATGPEAEVGGGTVAPAGTGVPHLLQNFAAPTNCIPHFVQKRDAGLVSLALFLRAPHFVQNGPFSVSAAPHCVQELSTSVLSI